MKTIPLSNGGSVMVDDADYEALSRLTWWLDTRGYARSAIKRKKVWMHRLLVEAPGLDVDHADGNPLNNQRSNLRPCTRSQNIANARKWQRLVPTTSRHKGVCWHPGRREWRAYIRVHRKQFYLGRFDAEADAARAYNRAALAAFGEFARINVVVAEEAA